MKKNVIYFISICLIAACHPQKADLVNLDEIQFSTTDASELYFKNIRKSSYQLTEMKTAGMDVFNNIELLKSNLKFKPSLIINWRNDQSFIMFDQLEADRYGLIFGDDEVYEFRPAQQRYHAELAILIYNAILNQQEVLVADGNSSLEPLFTNPTDSHNFRLVVFDFLRLVEIR